jgi:galactokinase
MLVSTPGRICLFGEHQDYLGLPVIAAAISRRIQIEGTHRSDTKVVMHLPDLDSKIEFSLENTFPYTQDRDYYKSAINVLKRKGLTFSKGFECTVTGNIPINSGTSSSSALIVSWARFLDRMSDAPANFNAKEIGEIAYLAEVPEFGEPGGMMDHYSTAIGHIIYLESKPEIRVEALTPPLGTFVLGDSLEPKDTIGILARCRYGMEAILRKVMEHEPSFNLFSTESEAIHSYRSFLNSDELGLLTANMEDRDLLRRGKALFEAPDLSNDFHKELGQLLSTHHRNLRDFKRTSTPKIDRMMDAALSAGALGGKINGSGGGGCMFAYAPGNAPEVAEAIEKAGGKSHIIEVAPGVTSSE